MEYDDAARDLKDIRVAMERSSTQVSRESGWFFLIQGLMYVIGFLATQFAPSIAAWLWLVLNVLGIAAIIAIGRALYGKRARQRHPGLASRIVGISIGVVVFDIILLFSFGLTEPGDFTLLMVLSLAFCYFVVGLIARQPMSVMGAFIALSVFASRMLFPTFIYLSVAVFCGGAFVVYGAATLLRKASSDA